TVSEATLSVVVENGGKLPLSEILRRRVRYFTAGGAMALKIHRLFIEVRLALDGRGEMIGVWKRVI
ncbi:MAG: hypothetical protein ACI9ZV_000397, partial [Candidatus Azotimanducaceae bacterium]